MTAALSLDEILGLSPVIPVLTIDDLAHAVPLGRALLAGGLPVLEITLRTPVAMACLERVAGEVEGAVVGAGTVLTAQMRRAAAGVGAQFCVSPGLIEGETAGGPAPLLPGVATATEVIAGLAAGFTRFKLFPANVAGGADALKAFASPFQQARFCPTGGVNVANAADYLALPNVVCVGGSWVAPADAVRAGDWGRITELARQAAALRS
ncbi:MAG TPA: bifunctional 4-hydroxy-2-oxoglutarate aldolase/2-dehydro-3-deoxy-phosphogluconate aldolase [Phenylobacterium sp.]|jgi:2-dehydro-3-deoxyphosphogluconate aldolase/(4S)-4-hydroxy-2-oxoglutarate aldolase|uniref:bifunctional 4-hydroxy-2-oxoglutarate aldolase/2-dehydro-3-deoxy-phosphogluconate aldolase n=1 Tax=Phenylobacterium sp. TaxID=1871053 RepID=UPI002D4A8FEC|nr:bifunctional 4-hydroxy-2-oxoglutarate aldolase/2-dehydro-3-deoxy-phosphogluconate aldolase [Phenylobacterium sp.]HZZ68449.1 bifunctional 4-hydroxy-2-oxoglutarate aldolase/2-dehydro-3-deoxy-phosphogluconate aldolase [Phenylobacterium sp.]